ncbi:hypothetical protein, partial [uncultured Alteromonas sp.]|uniref:hypothetical protein n=1 Tax=uncultured Alteromonas sp. TaxID=179113 RepID=UPI0030EE95FE
MLTLATISWLARCPMGLGHTGWAGHRNPALSPRQLLAAESRHALIRFTSEFGGSYTTGCRIMMLFWNERARRTCSTLSFLL